jgi:hypothetical protein
VFTRLAAIAAVPVIVLSVQATSPQTPHPNPPPQGGRASVVPLPQAGRVSIAPLPQGGRVTTRISSSLLPGSTATLKSATVAVSQLMSSLPLVVEPPVLPAVPALPLPTSLPHLP